METLGTERDQSLNRGDWLYVPRTYIRHEQRMKQSLTVQNGTYFSQRNMGREPTCDPYIILYRQSDAGFCLPRNFQTVAKDTSWAYPELLEDLAKLPLTSHRAVKTLTQWPHRIKARPRQVPAIAALKRPGDKILSLACGAGKTVCALAALCETAIDRLPALIIVNTAELMNQWEERIRQHVQMGPIRVGKVRGPVCDYRNTPFTLAMIQSLAQREYPPEFYDYFKAVVIDEVHHCGAPLLSQVAPLFRGERIGLSATPNRTDKNDAPVRAHLGPVCYQDLHQELEAKTIFVEIETRYDLRKLRSFRNPHQIDFARLMTTLARDQRRNDLILSYVRKLTAKGRKVLVVGERVEQLIKLAEAYGPEAAPCVGAMKQHERTAAFKKRVIFGIDKITAEALDQPDVDTLVLISPKTNPNVLQQAYGRILRPHPDKQAPWVVCFEDVMIPTIRNRCRKYRAWLSGQKFLFTSVVS